MTVPTWTLLGFALWTIAVLLAGIGIRRWQLILTGQAQLTDFPADMPHGSPAYRRAVRAHANCFENLPIYGAVVVALQAAKLDTATLDLLAIVVLAARIGQSTVHMSFVETNATILLRFSLFLTQLVAVLWMAAVIILHVQSATQIPA
jgi:hypothetical protein